MDIENVKKMIKKYTASHASFIQRAEEARRYYENETDILQEPSKKEKRKAEGESETPLRNVPRRGSLPGNRRRKGPG